MVGAGTVGGCELERVLEAVKQWISWGMELVEVVSGTVFLKKESKSIVNCGHDIICICLRVR